MGGIVLVASLLPAGGASASGPAAAPAAPRATSCPHPFGAGLANELARRWPHNRFTASLYDTRNGCGDSLRPDLRITTASVLKAEIMAGVLLRAQAAGRGLTRWESDRIWPMITQSDNPAAGALWSYLGGVSGMQSVDRAFGLTETSQASPWGITSTSAADRTRLLRQMLLGQYGPLSASYRATARYYMLHVVPSQDWGVTAGVPGGWNVPLKNGFYPSSCCGWRINTHGVVERPSGSAYVLTILSDGWPNEGAGIEAVDFISRVVAASVASSFPPFASPNAFVGRQYLDVLGRGPSFNEEYMTDQSIGYSTDRAPGVIDGLVQGSELDAVAGSELRLYLGGLARLPDPASHAHRLWQLRTGRISMAGLAQELATSPEMTTPAPLSPPAYVDRIYQRSFGRLPSSSDRQFWVDKMAAGTTRGQVMLFFTDSAEARWIRHARVLLAATHLAMLERTPAEATLDTWESRLAHGTPLTSFINVIYRSSEYRHRVT
ncbi:MAG: hypothetical protein JWM05_3306 [Acidimicrobiales bacterium]|nr:hypothetical protein [Acidimicrobiales bacterium]